MGFLDRAKKFAEQAKEKAEEALAEVKSRTGQATGDGDGDGGRGRPSPSSAPADPRFGTPYVPGMLGRRGWREVGLTDPAAILPVGARERAGVPHSTRSEVVAEPFGVGRRWTSGGGSAGLFYQLDPDQLAWEPASGRTALPAVPGATTATLEDGRALVFVGDDDRHVVLEVRGLGGDAATSLARAVADQLAVG